MQQLESVKEQELDQVTGGLPKIPKPVIDQAKKWGGRAWNGFTGWSIWDSFRGDDK